MQTALQVTFHNVPPSESLEAVIRDEAAALERYCDRITSCHVTVSVPHRRHRQGQVYQIRVRMAVPGDEVIVDRDHVGDPAHADAYVAVGDAFHVARRKLEDYVRENRGDVKTRRNASPGGRVSPLPS
jgi:ribosome-associated translation inhibitor RaiA